MIGWKDKVDASKVTSGKRFEYICRKETKSCHPSRREN